MEDQFSLSEKDFQDEKRKKVMKPLLWIGMASIVMMFAGFTSAVIVRKGDGVWLNYEMPNMFLLSSIIAGISSIFIIAALYMAKKDNQQMVKTFLWLTLASGLAFVYTQLSGFGQLVDNEIFLTGPSSNPSGSFVYIISGLHLVHLAGGIIALFIVIFNAMKGRYNSENLLGLQVCSTYWHFMGAMWIYLYVFFRMII
ncbi:MAG: cytochrome c oxidase subunit 3 [Vicingaceae bacterium]|jgi:cytochrome c oxidase subunit 3|tara:strand:+ start:256 stop:849 length:594 start_codon:yes stop_codon:yes gene_type:complete